MWVLEWINLYKINYSTSSQKNSRNRQNIAVLRHNVWSACIRTVEFYLSSYLIPKLHMIFVSVVQFWVLHFLLYPPLTADKPGFSSSQFSWAWFRSGQVWLSGAPSATEDPSSSNQSLNWADRPTHHPTPWQTDHCLSNSAAAEDSLGIE